MSINPNEDLLEKDLFVIPPDPELECPICLCVMNDPVQLNICQHLFCRQCIAMYFESAPVTNFCPIDNRVATIGNIVAAPRSIVNIIARLQIKCFYSANGCPTIETVENIRRHSDTCRFRPCGPRRPAPATASAPIANNETINVMVRLASTGKTCIVTINVSDTVRTLKLRIQEKEGIDPNNMVLNFKSKPLQDTEKLSQHGIKNSDMVWVSRRYEGGGH